MSEKDENSSCIRSANVLGIKKAGELTPAEMRLFLHMRRQAKDTIEFVDWLLDRRNEKQEQ